MITEILSFIVLGGIEKRKIMLPQLCLAFFLADLIHERLLTYTEFSYQIVLLTSLLLVLSTALWMLKHAATNKFHQAMARVLEQDMLSPSELRYHLENRSFIEDILSDKLLRGNIISLSLSAVSLNLFLIVTLFLVVNEAFKSVLGHYLFSYTDVKTGLIVLALSLVYVLVSDQPYKTLWESRETDEETRNEWIDYFKDLLENYFIRKTLRPRKSVDHYSLFEDFIIRLAFFYFTPWLLKITNVKLHHYSGIVPLRLIRGKMEKMLKDEHSRFALEVLLGENRSPNRNKIIKEVFEPVTFEELSKKGFLNSLKVLRVLRRTNDQRETVGFMYLIVYSLPEGAPLGIPLRKLSGFRYIISLKEEKLAQVLVVGFRIEIMDFVIDLLYEKP